MADPLSAVASAAGLVSLAIQLSQLSFQYVLSLKGSSLAWSSYLQELSALTMVLLKVQQASDMAGTKDHQAILPGPGIPSSCLQECVDELNGLKAVMSEKLQKRGIRGKLEMLIWPFSEADTKTKVEMLHRFSSLFSSSLVADNLTVSIANYRCLTDMKDVKEFKELLRWFEPKCDPPCISLETIAEEVCPGTREAILKSVTYLNWRDGHGEMPKKPLWVCGPPGCGKTVLSAAIVNDVLSNSADATVAYHFFGDSQHESLADVLRHLAYQHLSRLTATSELAVDLYRKRAASKGSLLPKDLVNIICEIALTSGRAYIVLDGVDEFPHFAKLMKHLPQFTGAKTHVLISSRDLPTIKDLLSDAALLDARADEADIESYVSWRLEEECGIDYEVFTTDLKRKISSQLVEHVKGSFLLGRLLMDSICCVTTIKKLRKMLESLPCNYEEAYKNTCDRILKQEQGRQGLARHALRWVCNSRRPLNVNELQHAIASFDNDPGYSEEDLETEKSILSSCLGLLLYSKTSQTIELVHSSSREFVLRYLDLHDEITHITIGRACLKYMSSAEMAKGPCLSLEDLKTRLTKMPFLEYVTRYYGEHVKPVQDELLPDLLAFLSNEKLRHSSWQLLHFVFRIDSQSAQDLINSIPGRASVLHVASYWGFSSVLQESLDTQPSHAVLDYADSHGWTALHWAASNGHTHIVERLLDAGADIGSLDRGDWTPLFWGVVKGHQTIVNLLLERGANPFRADGSGFTPLHWSVLSGAEEITTILLEHGKKVGRSFTTEERSIPAKDLTVEEAKAIQVPKKFKNLFQLVTQSSNTAGFEQLAASFDRYGWKGYYDAGLDMEHFEKVWDMAKVVLSKGEGRWWVDLQKESPIDGVRKQLLTMAIQCEDVEMVKAMLQLSLDLNKDISKDVVSERGAAYVHVAAYSGSAEIMQMLIDRGLSLKVTDERGMSPLHYACRTGTSRIVAMILKSGADVDERAGEHEKTPLMTLLRYGAWRTCHNPEETLKILQALFASGASIHARDSSGNTVIHHAVMTYDPAIIQALLDLGADPGAMSNDLNTPLHVLAQGMLKTGWGENFGLMFEGFNHTIYYRSVPRSFIENTVKLLLRISPPAALAGTTKHGSSALALAINNRKWILSQALHQAGAPFSSNQELAEDLDAVSKQGFYELARLLIRHGARPKSKDILAVISLMVPAELPHLWTRHLSGLEGNTECIPRLNHALVMRELLATAISIHEESSLPKPYWKMTAIQIAAERGVDAGLLAALLEGGADPYVENREGLDSFLLALVCGKLDNLTILLDHTTGNLSRDHWLTNFLQKSGTNQALGGRAPIDTYMIAIDEANLVNACDENGHSLLFHAVKRGNQLLVEELIKLGTDINLADTEGWTPFHETVRSENVPLANLLISHGADIFRTVSDVSPSSASPPSSRPYQKDQEPTINSLHIAVGANPHHMDLEARACLSPDMVRLLLEHGLDPNEKTRNTVHLQDWVLREEETPLQIMFRPYRHRWSPKFFEIVQMLVDFGADLSGIADRMKAKDVAKFEGYESLWELFRTAGQAIQTADSRAPF